MDTIGTLPWPHNRPKPCGCTTRRATACLFGTEDYACACGCHYENRKPPAPRVRHAATACAACDGSDEAIIDHDVQVLERAE